MRRFLTMVLAIHWTAAFAMLAVACTIDPASGFAAPLRFLGADVSGVEQDGGSEAAAFFAICFAVVAMLFFFALVEILFGIAAGERRRHPDFHKAFAAAAVALTLLLLAGAVERVPDLFATVESLLAASLASYLAIYAEWWARREEAKSAGPRGRAAARLMALGAAHDTLLPGLAGRAAERPEVRP